jgi:Domain of unknown function (DUF222)/HNH endonuclease
MFEVLSASGRVAAALIAPPGPDCVLALADIDPLTLSASAQVDLLIAWERQSSWLRSRVQHAMVAAGDSVQAGMLAMLDSRDDAGLPMRAAHAEIGMALGLSDVTASKQLMTARALTTELTAVQAALAAGEITFWHALAIVDVTFPLTPEKARIVADRVLGRAPKQTVSQLRRCLNRAVLAVDPKSAAERARQALADRKVDWWPLPDGMAELRLIASAAEVMAVYQAADAVAQKAKTAGDEASIPIDAPLARALAADGRWRRMVLDPQTGGLLDLGHTRYRPSEALARFVKTRDRVCAFATCNRAAEPCEVDHRQPYRPGDPTGGRTDRDNLRALCPSHHKIKHKGGWTLRTNPISGGCTWTSHTGHHYNVEPEDHRPMVAEPDVTECPF